MTATNMFKRLIDPADPSDVKEFYLHLRPTIPMDRALLCLDCEAIFEAEGHQTCPACGSSAAWAIGRALNREPQDVLAISLREKGLEAKAGSEEDLHQNGSEARGNNGGKNRNKKKARNGRNGHGDERPRAQLAVMGTH